MAQSSDCRLPQSVSLKRAGPYSPCLERRPARTRTRSASSNNYRASGRRTRGRTGMPIARAAWIAPTPVPHRPKLAAHKLAQVIVSESKAQVDDVNGKLTSSGSKFGADHADRHQQGSGQGERHRSVNWCIRESVNQRISELVTQARSRARRRFACGSRRSPRLRSVPAAIALSIALASEAPCKAGP